MENNSETKNEKLTLREAWDNANEIKDPEYRAQIRKIALLSSPNPMDWLRGLGLMPDNKAVEDVRVHKNKAQDLKP